MKAVAFTDSVMRDAAVVGEAVGMAPETLMKRAMQVLMRDLKAQVAYLEKRSARAAKNNPEGRDRVLALIEQGIPEEILDAEVNQKAVAAMVKKQKANMAYNQRILGEVLGFKLN